MSIDKKTIAIICFAAALLVLGVFTFGIRQPDYRELQDTVERITGYNAAALQAARTLESNNSRLRAELERGAGLIEEQGQTINDLRRSNSILRDIERKSNDLISEQFGYAERLGEYNTDAYGLVRELEQRITAVRDGLIEIAESEQGP